MCQTINVTWEVISSEGASTDPPAIDLDVNAVLPGGPGGEGDLECAVAGGWGGLHDMRDIGVGRDMCDRAVEVV